MVIYYSMIAWIVIVGLLTYGRATKRGDKGYLVSKLCAGVVFGYIIFWVGIRTRHGDTYAYILAYEKASGSFLDLFNGALFQSKSPLFLIFQTLIKSISPHDVTVFLMAIALIQGVPITLTLRKYSENFFYSAFLFIVTCSLFWMMNGIRQFLVVAILFGCTRLLIERRWKAYTLLVFILSFVHLTALIMLPIYWIATSKPWQKRSLFFILVIILCVVFVEQFQKVLEWVLEDTKYEGSTSQFQEDDGVNPLRFFVSLVPVFISFVVRKEIAKANDPFVDIMVNMSIITAALYLVGIPTSGILIGRLPIYTSMYNLILLPYLFNHYFEKTSKNIMYVICAIAYLLFFYLETQGYFYRSDLTGIIW